MAVIAIVGVGCAGGDGGEAEDPANPISSGTAATATAPSADDEAARTDDEAVGERAVMVGAEVLQRDGFALLAGQRVGVILNQASTVGDASLLDALVAAPEVEVVAAFGPEHGVRGAAPAGAAVEDSIDPATGVPVYSLYGEQRSPPAEVLATLDVLVFDLQDVGARPYTYIATMGLAMQAAADAGVAFVVLDRPNPLGGEVLAGPVLDARFGSFVGPYPIPFVHGLTVGELALFLRGEGAVDGVESLDLEVVPLEGWRRAERWSDGERAWVPPSPSLPTPTAAEVYPGTVLFEATSMSVGRGTDEPFTTVGAPWVDGEALAQRLTELGLPGVRFEPTVLSPMASEAVPDPPFAGERVGGVRVVPLDRSFLPFETGVHLLVEAQRHAEQQGAGQIVERPDFLDLLAGTDELRLGLAGAESGDELLAGWSDELAAFDQVRQPYLLYD